MAEVRRCTSVYSRALPSCQHTGHYSGKTGVWFHVTYLHLTVACLGRSSVSSAFSVCSGLRRWWIQNEVKTLCNALHPQPFASTRFLFCAQINAFCSGNCIAVWGWVRHNKSMIFSGTCHPWKYVIHTSMIPAESLLTSPIGCRMFWKL